MPIYKFHLENSFGPSGDDDGRELPDDDVAFREAGVAASEVLLSDFNEGHPAPQVTVTVERNGSRIGRVIVRSDIERIG